MNTFTKRLSLLVALILLVTVGGVYATWSYAATAGVTETRNKAVSLAPATMDGSLGTYEVLSEEFTLTIDQAGVGDYTPVLKFTLAKDDGSLDFKFTPNNVASNELKEVGIDSTVSFTSAMTHEGQAIFTFPSEIHIGTVGSGETYCWEKQDDGSFICSIPNSELSNYIQLAYTEDLDTHAKYEAFETSVAGVISVTIANRAASN